MHTRQGHPQSKKIRKLQSRRKILGAPELCRLRSIGNGHAALLSKAGRFRVSGIQHFWGLGHLDGSAKDACCSKLLSERHYLIVACASLLKTAAATCRSASIYRPPDIEDPRVRSTLDCVRVNSSQKPSTHSHTLSLVYQGALWHLSLQDQLVARACSVIQPFKL